MNPTLREIIESGQAETPAGEFRPLRDHVSVEEGIFLQDLIRDVRPRVTLEVGLAYGVSALFMCDALREVGAARHIAIDPLQQVLWADAGRHALGKAGFDDLVDFVGEPSELALPRLVAEGRRVEFAFIDGAHQFDHALLDFFYIDRLLTDGGIVVFDDASLASVHRVSRYVLTNRAYTVHATLAPVGPPRWRRLGDVAAWIPGARRVLKPSLIVSDSELGLDGSSRVVALRKERDDDRPWDFHRDF